MLFSTMLLGGVMATAEARPSEVAWRYAGQIPGATDIAVCQNGLVYATVPSGTKTNLVRTNQVPHLYDVTSTTFDEGTTATHISCGTDYAGYARLTLQDAQDRIYAQQMNTSYGVSFRGLPFQHVGTSPTADDVKALGYSQVLVHTDDRYDYRGSVGTGSWLTYSYLGDVWGAAEVAATGGSTEVAAAINDDDRMWVNFSGGSLNLDAQWEPLVSSRADVPRLAVDLEAARYQAGSTVRLYALLPGGAVWIGVVCQGYPESTSPGAIEPIRLACEPDIERA